MKEIAVKEKALYTELEGKQTYGSKVSSKMFYVLSSQLYKNKIRAIIRELSCNAVDAHKEAGNPGKFDVILPNILSPQFQVRDYGTGISEEDMYRVFCILFESTKDDSNEYTGMLGLGSKSPFAYTDNYMVTSYQDGYMKVYSAFMEAQKVPTIDKIHEEPTEEPNGLRVQFAVDEKDFRKFQEEAAYVFKTFWSIKPNIICADKNMDVDVLQQNQKSYCSGKIIVDADSGTHEPGWYAVQGDIAYPINFLRPEELLAEHKRQNMQLRDGCLFVNLPIGSVSFTPSREELENTEHNKNVLRDHLKGLSLHEELTDGITKKILPIKNQLDACLKFSEHGSSGNFGGFFFPYLVRNLIVESGFDPTVSYNVGDVTRFIKLLDIELNTSAYHNNARLKTYADREVVKVENPAEGEPEEEVIIHKTFHLEFLKPAAKNQVYIILNDTKKRRDRILKFLKSNHTHTDFFVVDKPEDKELLGEFLTLISGLFEKVWKFSDIEKFLPKRKVGVKKTKHKWFISPTGDMIEKELHQLGIEPGETFYYIPVHRNVVVHSDLLNNFEYDGLFKVLFNELTEGVIDPKKLVRLRKSRVESVQKHYGNFAVNALDLFIEKLKEVATFDAIKERQLYESKSDITLSFLRYFYDNLDRVPFENEFKKILAYEKNPKLENIIRLYHRDAEGLIAKLYPDRLQDFSKRRMENVIEENLANIFPLLSYAISSMDKWKEMSDDIRDQAQFLIDERLKTKEVFEL